MRIRIISIVSVVLVSTLSMASPSFGLGILPKGKKQSVMCETPLALVSIQLPKEVIQQQWGELGLEAPTEMLREVVQQSNCFTIAAGRGRVDYYLRPSLSFTKGNKFGSSIGSLAVLIPGVGVAGVLGSTALGYKAGKAKVRTTLELVDPRTAATKFEGSQTVASDVLTSEERAFLAQANSSYRSAGQSYAGTEFGRKVAGSYQAALGALVENLRKGQAPSERHESPIPTAVATTESRHNSIPSYDFTVPKAVNLRSVPGVGNDSSVLRIISQGELLRGIRDSGSGAILAQGGWTKVADSSGIEGWIRTDLLLQIQLPPLASN